MRRVVLTLAALGLLGLMADRSVASPPKSSRGTATMVKHRGYSSFYDSRYRSSRSYGSGRYGRSRAPVIVKPVVPRHPTVVYPHRGHPPVVHPPISRYRYPYYRPHSGFYYRGRGFGFSITF